MTIQAQRKRYGNTRVTPGNTPGRGLPRDRYVVGPGVTPGRLSVTPWFGEVLDICPACGLLADYDQRLDIYLHRDGTSNKGCRLDILRGRVTQLPVPHALYRFWAGEVLLYVGITVNPSTRWPTHERGKEWWEEITTITIERCPSRAQALSLEREAIRNEHPKYNIAHQPERASA